MTNNTISHILCAVYGRPSSRGTVTRAIDLALEYGARLTFVHVLDAEFLGLVAPMMSSLQTVYQQLNEMGEFTMVLLSDRATRRGVKEVDYLIRQGKIQRQLRQLLKEMHPNMLVIGRPTSPLGLRMFPLPEFEQFVAEIEKEIDARVIVVDIEQ